MPIISRALKRLLRRPTAPAVLDQMPDLTPAQLATVRRHDAARRAHQARSC